MRSIRLHLTIPGRSATAVYTTLAELGRDLKCHPGACHIVVSGTPETGARCTWEANFRQGVLSWVKEGPVEMWPRDGNVALFDGSWSCVDDGSGAAVTFAARLDMGVAASPAGAFDAAILENMAVRAFIDDAMVIMSCLFDGNVRVDDMVIQGHEPPVFSAA